MLKVSKKLLLKVYNLHSKVVLPMDQYLDPSQLLLLQLLPQIMIL